MMIKCPVCGSTSKVNPIYIDRNTHWKRKTDVYECDGCGCHFETIFDMTSFNILKEEN